MPDTAEKSAYRTLCDGYTVLRSCHVEALMEEWGDLDQDPFWQPQAAVVLSVEVAQAILATHFDDDVRPPWFEGLDDITREADDLRIHQSDSGASGAEADQ